MSDRLLVDTNLLLLMVIGGVDEGRYIGRSKRLGMFCIEDYDRVWELVGQYKEVWITAYIAAEVSNLIDLDHHARTRVFELAKEMFSLFKQAETSISEDSRHAFFLEFGLTDSSIINLAKDFDILTNDQRMMVPLFTAAPDRIIPYVPVKLQRN